jgi:hypothetical protein
LSTPSPTAPPRSAEPKQRYRQVFDLVLVVPTCALFLAYLPLLVRVPRRFRHPLNELDLYWALPLILICFCLFSLLRWAAFGITSRSWAVWLISLVFAGFGFPIAIIGSVGR